MDLNRRSHENKTMGLCSTKEPSNHKMSMSSRTYQPGIIKTLMQIQYYTFANLYYRYHEVS